MYSSMIKLFPIITLFGTIALASPVVNRDVDTSTNVHPVKIGPMHSTHTGDVDMFDMKGVNRLLNNLGTRDVVCMVANVEISDSQINENDLCSTKFHTEELRGILSDSLKIDTSRLDDKVLRDELKMCCDNMGGNLLDGLQLTSAQNDIKKVVKEVTSDVKGCSKEG